MDLNCLIQSIDSHMAQGRRLFPLKAGTKHALEENYKTTIYSKSDLVRALRSGKSEGLGWLLGPYDLVIDVDPRTEGALTDFKRLENKLTPEKNLSIHTTCILSGRRDGGCHYYMQIPSNVKPNIKYKTKLSDYPNLEFKSNNSTIVLPYSLHPLTKLPYVPHPLSPRYPTIAPQWLITALGSHIHETNVDRMYRPINATELSMLLKQLPITDFAHNDTWLPVLMASHHATNGSNEALETFVDWSLADPTYLNQEATIRTRWASLDCDKNDGITLATLNKLVIDHGGVPLPLKPTLLTPGLEDQEKLKLQNSIAKLGPLTPNSEIEIIIRKALELGPVVYQETKEKLISILKISRSSFADYVTRLKLKIRDEQNRRKIENKSRRLNLPKQKSLAVLLAEATYDTIYESKYLIHATNQQFYSYNGTHWALVPDNILTQKLYNTVDSLSIQYPKIREKQVQLIEPAKVALIALTATADDLFGFQTEPKSILNCANGELWIDSKTGNTKFKTHSADSYLLNCLPTIYDPEAVCPQLNDGLLRMFEPAIDPQDVIRHLWEIIGYICQPNKDIPAYFILHGRGENGKTHLSRIIIALIGMQNILPRALNDFLGPGNAHSLASLPGKLLMLDDDADIKRQLPESALKKLAETKEFEANPKWKTPFVFRATASPLILTNDWPRVRDLSHGMLRKAYIISFRQKFSAKNCILNFAQKIIDAELPGALNEAIQGLQRLRKRGYFEVPLDCKKAKDEWLQLANPIIGFVDTLTKPSFNSHQTSLMDLYQQYRSWCFASGIQRPIQQSSFEMSLLQLGYEVNGDGRTRTVHGLELKN